MRKGDSAELKAGRAQRWGDWRDRYEERVDRAPGQGPWGNCHLWTGATRGKPGNRYGVIQRNGRTEAVHRIALEDATGVPAGKLKVLHRCDVTVCVNPAHLFLGTQADNVADMVAKGRARGGSLRGEKLPHAVLREADVLAIRARYRRYSHTDGGGVLAREYGVSVQTINLVVNRKIWKHI